MVSNLSFPVVVRRWNHHNDCFMKAHSCSSVLSGVVGVTLADSSGGLPKCGDC